MYCIMTISKRSQDLGKNSHICRYRHTGGRVAAGEQDLFQLLVPSSGVELTSWHQVGEGRGACGRGFSLKGCSSSRSSRNLSACFGVRNKWHQQGDWFWKEDENVIRTKVNKLITFFFGHIYFSGGYSMFLSWVVAWCFCRNIFAFDSDILLENYYSSSPNHITNQT